MFADASVPAADGSSSSSNGLGRPQQRLLLPEVVLRRRRGYPQLSEASETSSSSSAGCARPAQRMRLSDALANSTGVAVLRVSAHGHEGFIIEGALDLLKSPGKPDVVYIEFCPAAMRAAGYTQPQQLLQQLYELGYTDVAHAGRVCDKRWGNVTRGMRLQVRAMGVLISWSGFADRQMGWADGAVNWAMAAVLAAPGSGTGASTSVAAAVSIILPNAKPCRHLALLCAAASQTSMRVHRLRFVYDMLSLALPGAFCPCRSRCRRQRMRCSSPPGASCARSTSSCCWTMLMQQCRRMCCLCWGTQTTNKARLQRALGPATAAALARKAVVQMQAMVASTAAGNR